jgi:ribonuclease E
MPDDTTSAENTADATEAPAKKTSTRKAPAKKAAAKRAPARRTTKKVAAAPTDVAADAPADVSVDAPVEAPAAAPVEAPPADAPVAEAPVAEAPAAEAAPVKKTAARKTTTRRTTKKAAAAPAETVAETPVEAPADAVVETPTGAAAETPAEAATAPVAALLFQAPDPAKAKVVRRTRKAAQPKPDAAAAPEAQQAPQQAEVAATVTETTDASDASAEAEAERPARRQRSGGQRSRKRPAQPVEEPVEAPADELEAEAADTVEVTTEQVPEAEISTDEAPDADATSAEEGEQEPDESADLEGEGGGPRRRRRRGGRRRRKAGDAEPGDTQDQQDGGDSAGDAQETQDAQAGAGEDDESGADGTSRRRRRRRRSGDDGGDSNDDPDNTVTRVRRQRSAEDEITSISGSTRLEAKKQRRRDGREAGRRRAPIVSEAEFLARRESVDRVMVVRQREDLTQIAVLEDKVLVEHYVARESQTSLIGNVYLGRVQNVLPSMEAAFIDIGKGRNAVLYAGEVNWSALGHKDGQPRKIESVLSSGQPILVQVSKDPIGHKGARLTSQVSLAGRFLVYVPDGTTSGISRKLPDTERNRLKTLLKEIVPDGAGVIVRTAAEGASEEELTRDVERLKARWEDIEGKAKGSAPQLLYGEPDLTLKVVRDLFTEDFNKLVIEGDDAWDTVTNYVSHVAPDLQDRVVRYDDDGSGKDVFAAHRIEEQIAKGLDRKVWLPSGGSLVIDRTEAMTVVDVNTGKFTGSGGNLEETVTKNNLEAAEEIVRQLRLRDIGGIIVVDFIDMVLESNRDLVLRRLVECLGRDRTRHQVAEVTSLGLVQMTRKRIGTGLVEAFSENCEHCQGRGVVIQSTPVEPRNTDDDARRGGPGRRTRGGKGRGQDDSNGSGGPAQAHAQANGGASGRAIPSPKDIAAVARPENAEKAPIDEQASPDGAPAEAVAQVEEQPRSEQPKSEQPRSGRSRGRGRSRREPEAPVEEPQATESVVEEPLTTESVVEEPQVQQELRPEQPEVQPSEVQEPEVQEPEVQEPVAPPAPPRVVTRTRRRAAAPVVEEPQAAESVVEEPQVEQEPRPEPPQPPEVEEPEVPEPEVQQPPAPPAPPRVVTRSRGRAASRPAGPPAGVTSGPAEGAGDAASAVLASLGVAPEQGGGELDGAPRETGPLGDDASAPAVEDTHQVEHVPVKKRSRKR